MKDEKESLTYRNIPQVTIFVIWCISIYVVFLSGTGYFWKDLQAKFAELNQKDILLVAIMPIIVTVFSGIISSNLKAKIVFWRLKYALPGHRVFTELAVEDARIDMNLLKEKMKKIPIDPKEQNTTWFKLYKKYENKITVKNAHKNFLLTRDLATISLIFSIIGTAGLIFGKVYQTKLLAYFGIMIIHYIILSIVAQNHGKRFVCNVLAEYIADN